MNYMYLEQMPSNKVLHLTKSGLDGLKSRLDVLTAERHAIFNFIQTAAENVHDRADLLTHAKIKELERDDLELFKILQVLKHATAVTKKDCLESVNIGSTVVLSADKGEIHEYTVVCPLEVDPELHKVSDESPFGKRLLGKRVGDTVEIARRNGVISLFTIIEIKFL